MLSTIQVNGKSILLTNKRAAPACPKHTTYLFFLFSTSHFHSHPVANAVSKDQTLHSATLFFCSSFNAEDAAAPLLYTDAARKSHFLKSLPKDVRQSLQDLPIAMENHGKGVYSHVWNHHYSILS